MEGHSPEKQSASRVSGTIGSPVNLVSNNTSSRTPTRYPAASGRVIASPHSHQQVLGSIPIPIPGPEELYPLVNFPTPPALKRLCFDLDGIPTHVKDSTGTLIEDLALYNESLPRKHVESSSSASSSPRGAAEPRSSNKPTLPPTPYPDFGDADSDTEAAMDLTVTTARSPGQVPPNLPSPKLSPKPEASVPVLPLPLSDFQLPPFNDDIYDGPHPLAGMDLTPPDAIARNPELADLPQMIQSFDALPQRLKSYVLLHLLRRCPVPTLQFVGSVILPSLKRDFFRLLPVELSHQIMLYLDLKSLGRCARVSKAWHRVVQGEDAEVTVWKARLAREGWLKEEEVRAELSKYRARAAINAASKAGKGKGPATAAEAGSSSIAYVDEIEDSDLDAGRASMEMDTSRRGEDTDDDVEIDLDDAMQLDDQPLRTFERPLSPGPLHIYRSLYRKHHVTRRNWVNGKYKTLSFPAHGLNVVTCLQFDDDKIVSGSDDQTMNVYDVRTGELRRRLEGHEGGVWALQYLGYTLVSGSTDRTVRVWDLDTGKCTHVFEGHTSTVRCLSIVAPQLNKETGRMEPEHPLVVTGSRDATLRVWRLPDPKTDAPYYGQSEARDLDDEETTGPTTGQQPSHYGAVPGSNNGHNNNNNNGGAAGADGNGGEDGSMSPGFGGENKFFMHVLTGHTNSVRAIAASGSTLVSGSYDTTVRVWNLVTGDCSLVLRGHREKVYSVGYSDELKRAVSGSMDATVRVWDTTNGDCLHILEGHNSLVGLLELTPSYLVSAAADATLKIWNPNTGACLATLQGHAAAITCFHHDPALNRIVSGSDGGVKMWELCSNPEEQERLQHEVSLMGGHGAGGTSSNLTYGRFRRDLVNNVQGVWRVRMDERRLVCAVQRENSRTYFDVLDFGANVDDEFGLGRGGPSGGDDGDDDDDGSGGDDSAFKRRKFKILQVVSETDDQPSAAGGGQARAGSPASVTNANRPPARLHAALAAASGAGNLVISLPGAHNQFGASSSSSAQTPQSGQHPSSDN